jgi:hypothetical protein
VFFFSLQSDVSNNKNTGLPPRASRTKKPAGVAKAAAAGLAGVNKTKKNGGKPPARRSARGQPRADTVTMTTTTTTIDASNKNDHAASTTLVAAAAAAGDLGKEQQALSEDVVVPSKTKNDRTKTLAAVEVVATKQSKEKQVEVKKPAAKKMAPRGRKKPRAKPAAAQRKKSETAHNNNNKNNKRSRLENSSSREEEEQPRPTKVRRKTRSQIHVTSPLRHQKPAVQYSHNLNVPSPFDSEAYSADIADHDAVNIGHVLEAPEYATDIYQRLFHTEVRAPHRVDTCRFVSFRFARSTSWCSHYLFFVDGLHSSAVHQ